MDVANQTTSRKKAGWANVVFVTVVVFAITTATLAELNMLPTIKVVKAEERFLPTIEIVLQSDQEEVEEEPTIPEVPSNPVPIRVVVESVDLDVAIESPLSTDIAVLDEALLHGAVHYPGSGTLNDDKNMFLFGHSSFLPVVRNQNFKAFNGLRDVEEGAYIHVYSSTHVHLYRVTSKALKNASDAVVELEAAAKKLTMTTCNSFGAKSDRWVVEAEFIGMQVLPEAQAAYEATLAQ